MWIHDRAVGLHLPDLIPVACTRPKLDLGAVRGAPVGIIQAFAGVSVQRSSYPEFQAKPAEMTFGYPSPNPFDHRPGHGSTGIW